MWKLWRRSLRHAMREIRLDGFRGDASIAHTPTLSFLRQPCGDDGRLSPDIGIYHENKLDLDGAAVSLSKMLRSDVVEYLQSQT